MTLIKASALAVIAVLASSAFAVGDEPTPVPPKSNPASVIIDGIPKSIEPAISKSPTYSYLVRIKAVHSLSHKLSSAEVEAIFKFLGEHCGGTWGFMTLMQFNAVKNEAVIALAKQDSDLSPVISDMMMDMYSDKSYDEMWRNYCVQFMGELYPRMDAPRRERCLKLLWPAVAESATCIPGAALIALGRIADADAKAVDKDAEYS